MPYSFTGDTNTGVCSSAADTVVVYTGGSRSLVCTAGNCEWYYSYTDASNYQRGALKTSASGIEIAAETAGSGADDLDITLTPAGAGYVKAGKIGSAGTAQIYGSGIPVVDVDFIGVYPQNNDTYSSGYSTLQWNHVYASRSIQGSKTKALTDAAAAVAVTRVAVATNSFMGGEAIWTATSTDGTDQRTLQGKIRFAGVDKAGTVTCAAPQVIGTDLEATTNGNHLTCTWSSATSTTNCDLKATCTDDTAGSQTITMNVRLDMPLANAVTPQ